MNWIEFFIWAKETQALNQLNNNIQKKIQDAFLLWLYCGIIVSIGIQHYDCYREERKPAGWSGRTRCPCWSPLSCRSRPRFLSAPRRNPQTSFLCSAGIQHILHTGWVGESNVQEGRVGRGTEENKRTRRERLRILGSGGDSRLGSRQRHSEATNNTHNRGRETHTCFVVDQLQNERSAGDDAWSSGKEVPEHRQRRRANNILIRVQRVKYYIHILSRLQPQFKTASCNLMGKKNFTRPNFSLQIGRKWSWNTHRIMMIIILTLGTTQMVIHSYYCLILMNWFYWLLGYNNPSLSTWSEGGPHQTCCHAK